MDSTGTLTTVLSKNHITTHSGRKVSLTSGVPSLEDIAVHLSKIVRFTGATRGWWTVLDHSLLMQELAAQDGHKPEVQLAMLLHDAHETIFEDTPSPFKPPELSQWQGWVDVRIFDEYYPGGWLAYADKYVTQYKKEYDRRAVLAEALLVGPPSFQTREDVGRQFGNMPQAQDQVHLLFALRHGSLGSNPADILLGVQQPMVQKFLARYATLKTQIKERTNEEDRT